MVPPGIEGYTRRRPSTTRRCRRSIVRNAAKKILTDLGYGPVDKPLKMEIRFNTSENHKNTRRGDPGAAEAARHRGVARQYRHQDALTASSSRRRLRHRARRVDRRLQGPETFLGISAQGVRQQLLPLRQRPVRGVDGQGCRRRRHPAERMKLLAEARRCCSTITGRSPSSLLQLTHAGFAEAQGWEDNVMDIHPTRFLSKE